MRIGLTGVGFSMFAILTATVADAGRFSDAVVPFPLARCEAHTQSPAASAVTSRAPAIRRVGQVRQFETANVALTVTMTASGAVQVDGRRGDFSFRKVVEADGRNTFEIEALRDRVSVSVTDRGIVAGRGGRTLSIDPNASPEQVSDVQRLLAGSRAVDLLRRVGADLEGAEDDSVAAVPLLLADSVIGALTGDVGAPRRTARLLSKRARSQVRTIGQRPANCYTTWENTVLWAFMDYEQCVFIDSWYFGWCSVRWTMQTESAWLSFLFCMGIGV